MSNKKKIFFGFILVVFACLCTTGCIFYNKLDSTDFKEHFAALGYTVSDSEESLYDADVYLVATKEDVEYSVEYYEFSSETEAKKIYKKYTDDTSIQKYITTDSSNEEVTGTYFAKFAATSENEYIIVSRVKNTLIFIATTIDYQNEIDDLLEDIGY